LVVCPGSELLGWLASVDGCVSEGVGAAGEGSGIGGGVTSGCGIGSGARIGAGRGAFFLALVFLFIVRLAFFFAPFLALRLTAKQSHRLIVAAEMVIKLA